MIDSLNIVEIFSSIQGEGKYVGYRQVFVRLAGCNLHCSYCDTSEATSDVAYARVEQTSGKRDFENIRNPIYIHQIAEYINNLLKQSVHHSVSFTGGEPLCQVDNLKKLLPQVKGRSFLETNGTLFNELKQIISSLDIVSMDIKLPTTVQEVLWKEHVAFLEIASSKDTFVKVVLSEMTTDEEFNMVLKIIKDVDETIPLILQPVTPFKECNGISPERVLAYQENALRILADVRVIPQTHKFINQL